MTIKQTGKAALGRLLERQARRLRAKHDFKLVAVVGSVGKTTTKLAIVEILKPQLRVQYQSGNYNDRLTVPLVLFGLPQPSLYNPWAWIKTFWGISRRLHRPYAYDVVVVELGADGPGQMQQFAYLVPDLVVVTAITDEHMLYFKTLDTVAHEELLAVGFSKAALINIDDCLVKYRQSLTYESYGSDSRANYRLVNRLASGDGSQTLQLKLPEQSLSVNSSLLGVQGAKAVLAAVAVARWCGFEPAAIATNAAHIHAVSGRMRVFAGQQHSTIIDDSYNASPVAVEAALDVLYALPNQPKIAILGSMNEMGSLSPGMHRQVGNYCDPSRLQLLVTIGADAKQYLAPAAIKRGCQVRSFQTPYAAGRYVLEQLMASTGAAVLVKGSQFGVYSEEAVKLLLANPVDVAHLVRQTPLWMAKKHKEFGKENK